VQCRINTPKGQKPPRPCPHSQIIDGEMLKSAAGGLTCGERRIVGITSNNTEGAGGYSGEHLIVICDEASALEEDMYQAFIGNTAAQGAKLVMVGNPTRQSGPFFDSHHRNQVFYHCIHVSSVEASKENVPGLASKEYCDLIRSQDDRGEESPFYQVRVLGDFPTMAESAIFGIADIFSAQDPDRYAVTEATGRLVISCDPAGSTGLGDESVITVVRGLKVLEQRVGRGWSIERHVAEMQDLRIQWWNGQEKPLAAIDSDGVGAPIATRLEYTAEHASEPIEVVRVYLGQNARDWMNYDLVGDESLELLSRWLRHGGVFPTSPKLEQEMQIMQWTMVSRKRGERKVDVRSGTLKKNIRQIIHRSPDRLDSMRIFAWAAHMRGCLQIPAIIPVQQEDVPAQEDDREDDGIPQGSMDPYSSMNNKY
jgi:phage terminase large subunit